MSDLKFQKKLKVQITSQNIQTFKCWLDLEKKEKKKNLVQAEQNTPLSQNWLWCRQSVTLTVVKPGKYQHWALLGNFPMFIGKAKSWKILSSWEHLGLAALPAGHRPPPPATLGQLASLRPRCFCLVPGHLSCRCNCNNMHDPAALCTWRTEGRGVSV